MASFTGQRRSDVMATAMIVLLLSVTGAGIGFSVGALLQPDREAKSGIGAAKSKESSGQAGEAPVAGSGVEQQEADTNQASEDEESTDEVVDPSLRVVPIPAVLTTLAAPDGKWIRLEGSILVEAESRTQPELLAEKAGEQILTYLRTVRLDQLQGPSGFLALRDDLNETVHALSGGEVRAILIHGLLVE